jgi:hypothetical protein
MATLADSLLHLIAAVGVALVLAGGTSAACYATCFEKTPQHTSQLTGQAWVDELLNGHEGQFYNELGMHKHVFWRLLNVLERLADFGDTKHITAEEQLSIFLHFTCRVSQIGPYLIT